MITKEKILESFDLDETTLFAEGLDDAILGVETRSRRIIYSIQAVLNVFMSRDDMSYDDALEFFDFNIGDAYMGEQTPIWCNDLD